MKDKKSFKPDFPDQQCIDNQSENGSLKNAIAYIFVFITLCFPKAGIATGILPITVSMVLFVGYDWSVGGSLEGFPLIIKLYGVTYFILYFILLLSFYKDCMKTKYIKCALIALFVNFCVDGSLLYPPTLMNIFIVLGVVHKKQHEEKISGTLERIIV